MNPAATFKPLLPTQVATLVEWANREGWEPGLHDAQSFAHIFPDAFYGLFLGDELAGGGALVNYGGLYGFMGFFLIRPDLRGRGLGRSLWFQRRDLLLTKIRPGASIGMDGVVPMQPFYQKGGFALAYRDERRMRLGESLSTHQAVSLVQPADLEAIAEFDLAPFGFPRSRFLSRWLFQPDAQSFLYRDQGRIAGYCTLRRSATGRRIGPLFAESPAVAHALYQSCLAAAPGEKIFLDVPMDNPAAVALANDFDAQPIFECGRMYYGPQPRHRLDQVFGLSTFEVG